jgi:hypothetical protein
MTGQVDELARHVRRLGNHELNELLLQLPKATYAALVEVALARPVLPAGLVLAVRASCGCGWLDGGGLCPTPPVGHPDSRPRPERPGGAIQERLVVVQIAEAVLELDDSGGRVF